MFKRGSKTTFKNKFLKSVEHLKDILQNRFVEDNVDLKCNFNEVEPLIFCPIKFN